MSESKLEEVICVLWLISAMLSAIVFDNWFTWVLFAKAFLDFVCAMYLAVKEAIKQLKEQP